MLYITRDQEGVTLWSAKPTYDNDLLLWYGENLISMSIEGSGEILLALGECKPVGLHVVCSSHVTSRGKN